MPFWNTWFWLANIFNSNQHNAHLFIWQERYSQRHWTRRNWVYSKCNQNKIWFHIVWKYSQKESRHSFWLQCGWPHLSSFLLTQFQKFHLLTMMILIMHHPLDYDQNQHLNMRIKPNQRQRRFGKILFPSTQNEKVTSNCFKAKGKKARQTKKWVLRGEKEWEKEKRWSRRSQDTQVQ